ncbi:hypothetical protein GCM10010206_62610 [Streptomyces cinerochromogenes]|nr:hypothetical protein GCM10010206_62610 [Streptomyces cinerochromogenes]
MTTRQRSTSSNTDPPVRREVVLGVDTHGEMHVAAVTSPLGKVLGNESFPATAAGYRQLLVCARKRGTVRGRCGPRMMAGAGIEPTVTKVRSGEAELSRITGARTPSGAPLDGGPAVPRPKNSNAPFRGLGTSKGTSRGAGGTSRKAGEARKLAEARKAALVRRNG